MMLCFCFAFLPSRTVPQPTRRSRNLRACDKSFAAFFRRSADGSCKHGNIDGGRSTGCQATPSRLTRLNERFARPYHLLIMGPSGLELFEDPVVYSTVFLDEIDYIKASHLSYDWTMSHSCLLGFLCQNLFQGAILGSLKEWLFWISIQRVTLTTMLSNCFVNLSVNPLSVFLTTRPILPQPAHLSYLPFPEWGFLFLSLLHRQQEP